MAKNRLFLFVGGLLLALPPLLSAVKTESFEHASFTDFLGGEFQDVSLSSSGSLSLSPKAHRRAGVDDPIVWKAIADADGTLFFATGNEGHVYRMAPGEEPQRLFTSEEVLTRSLALGPDGKLYVGTSPDGRLYRIPKEGGDAEVVFNPEETYLWDLIFDNEGALYVATGDSGRIYRLPSGFEPGAEAEVFFDSTVAHVSRLAWDVDGNLLAGTSPNGYLYRLDAKGNGFVILDAGSQEIREIAVSGKGGSVYVATFGTGEGSLSALNSVAANAGENGNAAGSNSDRSATGSVIYRIDPNGFIETYTGLPRIGIHSMVLHPNGELLVGTGNHGRIFSVAGSGDWKLLQDLESGGEISVLLRDPLHEGQVLAFSSNPARVYQMDFSHVSEGQYTSPVYDARQVTRWGRFHIEATVRGESRLRLSSRIGNTGTPEQTWSDWSEPVTWTRESFPLRESASRYIQYRLHFEGKPESEDSYLRVDRTRGFFRHFNRAPVISAIKLVPASVGIERVYQPSSSQPSVDFEQLFRTSGNRSNNQQQENRGQMRVYEKPGMLTLAWQVRDPNGDTLRYTLKMRAEGESDWLTVADDLRDPFFSFDALGFKEGNYYAKVIADDHLSNPPGEGRYAEKISEAFVIDNTAPELTLLEERIGEDRAFFRIHAEDRIGVIRNAAYSLNGGNEKPLFPEDGLFDSRIETFQLALNSLNPGQHSLIVRAVDEAGNTRVLHRTFTVK